MLNLYKHIKRVIPNQLKYPAWYLFKSPQRALGMHTIFGDLKGMGLFMFRKIFAKKELLPVSICTGIYNRSEHYLNNLLPSLNSSEHKDLIELSVFDCVSEDIPDLEMAIRKQWKGKLVFSKEPVPFSRSYTFNKAIAQASSPIVFLCDADLSLPSTIVTLCNNYTGPKTVCYPIYFFLFKKRPAIVDPQNGEWEQYGTRGALACLKSAYQEVGRLDEKYTVWGEEDIDLWKRFHQHHFMVIRNRQKGMFHHWHNTFNPKYKHMNDA